MVGSSVLFGIYLQIYFTSLITGYHIAFESVQGCYSDYTNNRTQPKDINLTLSCNTPYMVHILEITYMRPSGRGDILCQKTRDRRCCKFDLNEICLTSMQANDTRVINATSGCQNETKCVLNLEPFHMDECSMASPCHRERFGSSDSCWGRIAKVTYVCYRQSEFIQKEESYMDDFPSESRTGIFIVLGVTVPVCLLVGVVSTFLIMRYYTWNSRTSEECQPGPQKTSDSFKSSPPTNECYDTGVDKTKKLNELGCEYQNISSKQQSVDTAEHATKEDIVLEDNPYYDGINDKGAKSDLNTFEQRKAATDELVKMEENKYYDSEDCNPDAKIKQIGKEGNYMYAYGHFQNGQKDTK